MLLVFCIVLYVNRAYFAKGQAPTVVTRSVRFLTGGYCKQYFYWELVELFRRLTISGWVRA